MDHADSIIAAASALIGTALGTIASLLGSWIDRKKQHSSMLVQKLEDLTAALHKTLEWKSSFDRTTTFEQSSSSLSSMSMLPLETLTTLYFPRIVPAVSAYTNGLRSYHSWALRHLLDGDFQPVGLPPQTLTARLRVFSQVDSERHDAALLDLHQEVVKSVQSEARRLLG